MKTLLSLITILVAFGAQAQQQDILVGNYGRIENGSPLTIVKVTRINSVGPRRYKASISNRCSTSLNWNGNVWLGRCEEGRRGTLSQISYTVKLGVKINHGQTQPKMQLEIFEYGGGGEYGDDNSLLTLKKLN